MGKSDFLTPKAIANRIKAKGLGKLKWYCQMCQKQCRDENGFKCHLTSDSHRRQMELFGLNPNRVIDGYSEEFHEHFMEHLRRAHPHVRIEAHKVYNEYIQDKNHVHMNATKWLTLTEYVKYLGREGFCKVEETPKGWFMQVIHRDTEQEKKDADRSKRKRVALEESLRQQKEIAAQVHRAAAHTSDQAPKENKDRPRFDVDQREAGEGLVLQIGQSGGVERRIEVKAKPSALPECSTAFEMLEKRTDFGGAPVAVAPTRKKTRMEQIMDQEKARKVREASTQAMADNGMVSGAWISQGLVVKVLSDQLKEYYKKKGTIISVPDQYIAEVEMLDSGDILRIDQAELETVIPKAGGKCFAD
eukprot:jgi/Ulvmu1/2727/UM014_0184.1